MKIAICGKGGSGKSTVTTLLAKELSAKNQKVLVIDCDESNYGLHQQLGMELSKDFTELFGGKKKVLPRMLFTMQKYKFIKSEWKLADIPDDYCSKKDNIILMASGKIHEANEGCACAMGTVISQFIENLRLGENEFTLIDMEAGIEHFGRGVDNAVDAVIMVVDPSYESLKLAKKVARLCESINKKLYFVLNKTNEQSEALMTEEVSKSGEILACLAQNSDIQKAGLMGSELDSGNPVAVAVADKLLQK